MKKIDFGFNDDSRLNAQWSGIEFYNGEYLDVVGYENMDFLITRIIDSYRGLNGGIDVREIAQDYYADGSYVTYSNKEKNEICKKLEVLLNNEKIKDKLNQGKDPFNILRDAGFPVRVSHLYDVPSKSNTVPAVVTTINPDMFKKLKNSKRHSMSMYDQFEEIQKLRAKLAEMEELNRTSGRSI